MSWTDERIEKLTKMWESGSTASQIAEELGGVSRNAVIGKAHRLGLKSRPSPVKAAEKKKPAPKPKRLRMEILISTLRKCRISEDGATASHELANLPMHEYILVCGRMWC